MKTVRIISFLMLVLSAGFVNGQDKVNWINSYAEAAQISKETEKPIAILFSGSDWCKPCIKLKKYIIETDTFARYAENLVMYNADFPYRIKQSKELKAANEALAEQFNPKGVFPKLIVVSTEGEILFSSGYSDSTPEMYVHSIEDRLKHN